MGPEAMRVTRATPASRAFAVAGAVLVLALVCAPYWAGRAELRLIGELFLYLALASLWNLLAGYAGLVSVGQQAFVGFGGYMLVALTVLLGLHPFAAVGASFVLGALVTLPVALIIFRLRGAYFAIGTWVVAEVFRLCFSQLSILGGGSGISLPVAVVKSVADSRMLREWVGYWMALGMMLFVLLAVWLLLRSRHGLALTAIRDNETAASSLGIDIWRTKLIVYVAVGALTSMMGSLIFLQKLRITPDAAFSVNDWTAFVIFIVVIGGIGTIEGPIIGTLVFFALRELLADLGSVYLIVLGVVAIVIMLRAPRGIWGYVRQRFNLELFPLTYQVQSEEEHKRAP